MGDGAELPGILSDKDIDNYIKSGKIIIWPYEKEENLTPIGYNLTPTEFIFSINNRLLLDIHNDNNEKYCYVNPHDTVLILTREAVYVSKEVAGTFHSKVGIVTKGFGHISTTLDPGWQGPLLISLNNPTNQKLKFVISKVSESSDKHDKLSFKYCSFVTLIFCRLVSEANINHDNSPCRFDLLKHVVKEPKLSIWSKTLFGKRYKIQYDELRKFINNIAEIDFIKLGIMTKENKMDVEEFKKKYDKFRETIDFYTEAAHDVNREINNIKKTKVNVKKGLVVVLVIFAFCMYLYIGWKFGVKNYSDPNKNGYIFLMYFLAIPTVFFQVIKFIYKTISGNTSEMKGE